ncbi:hypothetical protein ACU4GD_25630 [Cupriavidus basilensis]
MLRVMRQRGWEAPRSRFQAGVLPIWPPAALLLSELATPSRPPSSLLPLLYPMDAERCGVTVGRGQSTTCASPGLARARPPSWPHAGGPSRRAGGARRVALSGLPGGVWSSARRWAMLTISTIAAECVR